MDNTRRIRILESQYLEKNDLIMWKVLFLDNNDEQTYVWPSIDLLNALNIKGKVTTDIIHDFCQRMVLKEVNFVVDAKLDLPKYKMTDEQQNFINQQIEKEFDNFKKAVGEM